MHKRKNSGAFFTGFTALKNEMTGQEKHSHCAVKYQQTFTKNNGKTYFFLKKEKKRIVSFKYVKEFVC